MKTRKPKIIGIIVLLVGLLLVEGLSGAGRKFYYSRVVRYPEAWLKMKPGMTSREAWALLGPPHSDAHRQHLKMLDRWEITTAGVEMHLDLYFGSEPGQSLEDAKVERVIGWKHLLGVPDGNFDSITLPSP